ncbi:hypothetical protein TcG_01722 [Trypanosoma cruzi]|nr:hypothetical protein TcG_01722 [Trypanosoma cruzi]
MAVEANYWGEASNQQKKQNNFPGQTFKSPSQGGRRGAPLSVKKGKSPHGNSHAEDRIHPAPVANKNIAHHPLQILANPPNAGMHPFDCGNCAESQLTNFITKKPQRGTRPVKPHLTSRENNCAFRRSESLLVFGTPRGVQHVL